MNFSEKVWELCKKVPRGKVTTYGEIARALGCKASRAVGNALNRNPYAPVVPCHRVVRSSGEVGGFAKGSKAKIKMLESEGITIYDGRIKDFKNCFYKLK